MYWKQKVETWCRECVIKVNRLIKRKHTFTEKCFCLKPLTFNFFSRSYTISLVSCSVGKIDHRRLWKGLRFEILGLAMKNWIFCNHLVCISISFHRYKFKPFIARRYETSALILRTIIYMPCHRSVVILQAHINLKELFFISTHALTSSRIIVR